MLSRVPFSVVVEIAYRSWHHGKHTSTFVVPVALYNVHVLLLSRLDTHLDVHMYYHNLSLVSLQHIDSCRHAAFMYTALFPDEPGIGNAVNLATRHPAPCALPQ